MLDYENTKIKLNLIFGIVQYTSLTQKQSDWINDLSIELESFFQYRNYGEDLNELYFGLLIVKPEFDQFFKKKRPRYKSGERTLVVDGIEIKSNNRVEIDCKFDFSEISVLGEAELKEKVCSQILTESDCLTRLSKLNKFDFKLFKLDFENYLVKKNYLKE